MKTASLRLGVVAALFVAGFYGCSSAEKRTTGNTGGEEETGGSEGTPTGGSKATGGGSGKATGGSTGSTGGATGGSGPATGGSSGETGGAGGATGGAGGATGGASGETGGAGGGGAGGAGGGGAGGAMGGPVLSCWPDPKVIKICHQLENACENCGPLKGVAPPRNTKAKPCFDLVAKAYKGMATDADCAQHAIDNDCTVDGATTTGNLCGSLDCNPMTCGGTFSGRTCESAKQWGDSSICKNFYAKCPCK
jgi:hypothetical protein